jgi:hypothetical protein
MATLVPRGSGVGWWLGAVGRLDALHYLLSECILQHVRTSKHSSIRSIMCSSATTTVDMADVVGSLNNVLK